MVRGDPRDRAAASGWRLVKCWHECAWRLRRSAAGGPGTRAEGVLVRPVGFWAARCAYDFVIPRSECDDLTARGPWRHQENRPPFGIFQDCERLLLFLLFVVSHFVDKFLEGLGDANVDRYQCLDCSREDAIAEAIAGAAESKAVLSAKMS